LEVFVARQPIFDLDMNVVAYELLFRTSLDNFYDIKLDGDESTAKLISNSFLLIGLDTITKQKKAFINFTKKLLIEKAPTVIPNDLISVEVMEDIQLDAEVIKACSDLKDSGYEIVLDNFVYNDEYKPIVDLADIIKIDFQRSKGDERREIVEQFKDRGIKFLAEKLETVEEFEKAISYGYDYFQGYFFCKPIIISERDIPVSKLSVLEFINEINMPDVEFEKLEEIIKHDLSLTYRLLRFINSAYFNFSMKVESIRHVLLLIGMREIKKWASIIALGAIGEDKPVELLNISLVRAKFCEFIAEEIGQKRNVHNFFMMGLFSLIDALLDRHMEDVLKDIYIEAEVKAALLGEENIYSDVHNLVIAYEKGDWEKVNDYTEKIDINEIVLPTYYFSSTKWANVTF
jgi:EAL and modified HD-GYP domain-containing signal transduction protein